MQSWRNTTTHAAPTLTLSMPTDAKSIGRCELEAPLVQEPASKPTHVTHECAHTQLATCVDRHTIARRTTPCARRQEVHVNHRLERPARRCASACHSRSESPPSHRRAPPCGHHWETPC